MESKEIIPTLPQYVTDQLSKIAKNAKFIENDVHLENGSKHGNGFMADMIAVTLRGKLYGCTNDYELPLICKIMPGNAVRQEAFGSVAQFKREAYFYNTIAPIFSNFLKEKEIDVDAEFSVYPKCFAAISDSVEAHYVIVLENLTRSDYGLWDKTVAIDFDEVAFVLSELGKFHAVSFAIRDQKRDIFDELFRVREVFFDMFKGNGISENVVSGAIQQAIDILDDQRDIEIMENVKSNYETWLKDYLKENAAGEFSVLNHGDFWNNNIMFSKGGQERKLSFIDFQLLRLASPAIDISYYLCTSTNPEIHQRFNELLHIYYDSLTAFLTKLGSEPQKLITFDDLQNQFQQFGKYGLIFSPILIPVLVSESSNIVNMDSIKKDSDTKGLAALNEKTKIDFRKRLSSAIQLAVSNGWI